MYSKFFTRLFLLIGIIGMFSVPLRAEEVTIGSGTDQQPWLPSHSNYKCSYTQQIYTADEIDHPGGGIINSIAFYNKGTAKTRTWDVYLVNTDKSSFTGANNDWVDVSQGTLVFSGSISLTANQWTPITFTTAFDYTGSNLAVVVNDKTGSFSSGQSCLVFTPSGNQGTQAHYIVRDGNPYDPSNPNNGYSSNQASVTYKNQIILDIEACTVTCAKPKNFNATNITAHTAILTWTAGTEGQSNWDVFVTTDATIVPNENTTPTYQVTECSKALTDLTAQTTYYAYVRANCGDGDLSKWASKTFTTTREALAVDANHPYSQDFEANNDWGFINGSQTNQWSWGNATNNGGTKSMYISNDGGTNYVYTLNSTTVVFASKLLNFEQGTYTFSFNWQAKGEGSSYTQYDYLRAVLAPGDVEFTAGSLPSGVGYKTLPDNWIPLDGGQQLNLQDGWQSQTSEATISGTYTMVFIWRNDSGGGNQPPAAIDNISISYMTCPRPTNLTASNVAGRTATLSWTENGTATNWVLQYATNSSFTDNLSEIAVSGTAAKDLTDLAPETKYYVRVKSVLGNEESSWSDVTDFTTTATCEKPTNWKYTPYSATAYSGSVEWEGNANGYNIAYRPTSDFDPSDETLQDVTRVTLGSVSSYTLQNLTPETKYYVYIQADCGSENGTSSWSNRVIFTTEATCLVPSGLSATVTSTTITLSWTAGAEDQDAWDIRYKKSTDSEYTYIHLDSHPETSYTITGLSPVTTYDVNVRAWCDENDQSKWGASVNQSYDKSVTTACGAIELPYTCDFEGTSQTVNSCIIPSCWSVIRGYYNSTNRYGVPTMATPSTSTQPIVQQTHSGSYSLYFLNSTSYGTTEEYAILPEISEVYKMSNIQIRFWVRSYSSPCTMEVGVMTDPSNANTYVKIEDVEMTSTYTEKTISLNNYPGNGRYIALKCPAPTMYSQAFYVDDITVEYIPSCQVPDNLEADEVGVNEATLTWTPRGDETAWNIQYKKVSDDEWSNPIAVDETTYTLTGLQRATEYEVRVQANCDDNDQSDWTNPISFETECGIWPIDEAHAMIENFNGETFPPDCWQKINFSEMGITNGWLQTFNNPLDNNGAVSSDFKHETWLFLPQMHIDGEAFLSFDHLFGSGDVYIPSSIMISTTPNLDVQGILTEGFIDANFTVLWTADENNLPTTKRNEVISLSNFDGEDVYIAFRYEGTNNYQGKIWYIDNVQVYVNANQTVELTQGWNWWSTYIEQDIIDGLTMLENSLGHNGSFILSQGLNVENYYSQVGYDYWWGDLSIIQNEKGYKVKVSESCDASMMGKIAVPENHPICIQPNWNWIGYPCTMQQSIDAANFQPSDGDVIVKQGDNSTYYENYGWWPEFIMEPGKGYQYYSTSTETKSMVFSSTRSGNLPETSRDNHWAARNFKNYKPVKGIILIDGIEQFSDRYEIGAFCGDECRASIRAKLFPITNQYVVNLTIGSDLDISGELITFRIYDHQMQQELDLESTNTLTLDDFEPMGTINNWFQYTFVTTAISFPKDITAYTPNAKDHYYLIASPIGEVSPADVTNMLTNTNDLYYFDQSASDGLEWRNYKASNSNFNLEPGKGYLYANSGNNGNNVTLTFTGAPYNGSGEVTLARDESVHFKGWNLVGNPFAVNAYIGNRQFYVMNSGGTELEVAQRNYIEPMEGIFVIAGSNNETLTFTTTPPSKGGEQLIVNLTQNRGASTGSATTSIDRAIVGFGEGDVLPKFMLNENNTKLYIPQGNQNYAVVRSADQGEFPLNFRASKKGTYTLNIDTENVEMNYLHLIDNMTGMDVDLLQNPSYTFEATTRDYESRFRLVFASSICGDADGDNETFAFYSNGNWIINNNGKATLQIVDLNGQILCNEQINGCYSKSFEAAPGIYMLRLVNGDNVKVQKVVVR